jgi:hypothetical protein
MAKVMVSMPDELLGAAGEDFLAAGLAVGLANAV